MTQQKLTERKTCFDSITGLRGIACLCIVCYHFYCLYIDDPGLSRELAPWYPGSKYFFEYSKNAAEMFFLISGFLIAWHYRNQIGKLSFGTFFRQRYGKLIGASVFVNLWALVNVWLMTGAGMGAETAPVTVPRFLLSLLMFNTGWFTSYARTGLPVCSTMWYALLRSGTDRKRPTRLYRFVRGNGAAWLGLPGQYTRDAFFVEF